MKKILYLGVAGLMALAATSCKDDVLADFSNDKPLDHDQSFFANISVSSAYDLTRADDPSTYSDEYDATKEPGFDKGNDTENDVRTIFLVFYDQNGDRVATTQVMKDNGNDYDGRNNSENKLYTGVVQIDVKHGSLPPAQVMCFINPITATNFELNPNFATLDALQRTTRTEIIDNTNHFAMSKSAFYGKKSSSSTQPELILATPIEEGQLFTDVEAARAALADDINNNKGGKNPNYKDPETGLPSSVIDIYVERYAAKVDFGFKEEKDYIFPQENVRLDGEVAGNYKLKFVPEYWAVNAYENETYICKSFFPVDEATGLVDFSAPMTYGVINEALTQNGYWYWNSPDYHRCYWAQSPAYYAKNYPRVADDILDKQAGFGVQAGGYALGYYSYDEMKANAKGNLADKARNLQGNETFKSIYVRENTVQGKALRDAFEDELQSPKAAIPSVVLVGHYELSEDGGATYSQIGSDTQEEFIYVMGNATNGYTLFRNYDEMLTYFVKTTVPFAKNASGVDSFFDYDNNNYKWKDGNANQEYKQYFKITHPGMEVRRTYTEDGESYTELVLDSRYVTIQLDYEKFNDASFVASHPLYVDIDGEWTRVTGETNLAEINKQMLYAAGTVQGYSNGRAYFSIPIQHLGFHRDKNPNAGLNANDKNFKWDQVHSGDFGLVRNHVYTIEVSDIKGLGNGIPNPGDPIIPPTDPEEYFIGARIIVLNWAIVPKQTVTL